MTVPRHPGKLDERALVTPAATMEYFYDDPPPAPDAVVLCFRDELFDRVATRYETTPFEAFGEGHALDETGGEIGVVRVPGVGAPAAALTVEVLIARGTRTFVSVGHVGGLYLDAQVGDVVIVDRALRDEGTSYHYLEPGAYVDADDGILASLDATLDAAGEAYAVGPTWTTDAPYRETNVEVERYRDEGVLTVDMEAAGVFAVAEYRGVAAGAAFTVSDILDIDGWEPAFDETGPHLERVLACAVEALRSRTD